MFSSGRYVVIFFLMVYALWGGNSCKTYAQDIKNEVVFLLDVSQSMNITDEGRLAPDALAEILYMPPSDYAVGFVAYGDDIQAEKALQVDRGQVGAALQQTKYVGYTNTGAGLEKALTMFSQAAAVKKTVILVTDGEIMLDTPEATQVSENKFRQAVQKAKERNIRIYTVAIGDVESVVQSELYEPANPQTLFFQAGDAGQLGAISKKILYEAFGIVKTAVSSGGIFKDTLRVALPLKRVDFINQAKILLPSTSALGDIGAGYTAQSGEVLKGKRFAVVNLLHPKNEAVELHFGAAAGGSLQADLMMEIKALVQTEVEGIFMGQETATAEVRLLLVEPKNQNVRFLDDPFFADKPVRVEVDNDEIAAAVKDGAIQFFLPADAARSVEAKIHYEDLGVHFIAPEVVHIEIQQTENNGILLLSIAAVAVSIGCFVCWRMRKPQPKLPDPPPASRYEYAGKLKLYVTQSPDDGDIAPMEYNLYRNFRKEEISLGTILEHCGIKLPFSGAHKIFFCAWCK